MHDNENSYYNFNTLWLNNSNLKLFTLIFEIKLVEKVNRA